MRYTNFFFTKFSFIIFVNFITFYIFNLKKQKSFGLNRKYDKFLTIKESYNSLNHKTNNGARKPIKIDGVNYISLKEAANILGIHHDEQKILSIERI